MEKTITVLSGDGVGSEICYEAVRVMDAVTAQSKCKFNYIFKDFGGTAIEHYGTPLPFDTRNAVNNCDAVLLGIVGRDCDANQKSPESGFDALLKLTEAYAKLQPIKIYPELFHVSPLRPEIISNTDILMVRELSGGIYQGEHGNAPDGSSAFDVEQYSGLQIQKVAELAFRQANSRNKKLCSVDMANKLASSKLWRRCVEAVSKDYPDVILTHMNANEAAHKLIFQPNQFDVILCSNMLGDIICAQASAICGAVGTLPSAYIGKTEVFQPLYQNDSEGQNSADPIGAIRSCAMMLQRLGFTWESQKIEKAIVAALQDGIFTKDLNDKCVTCSEMADEIIKRL